MTEKATRAAFRLSASLLVPGLILTGVPQAFALDASSTADNPIDVYVRNQNVGLLDILIGGIPTFSMNGYAAAYEMDDDFTFGPKQKVDTSGPGGGLNPGPVSEFDSAFVVQSYGDPQVTDTALAAGNFNGEPILTLGVLSGISARMSPKTQTHESSVFPALATASVNDPFIFGNLTGNEGVGFSSRLGDELSFVINTEGAATSHELRQSYDATLTIDGVDTLLYSLVIAVGTTGAGEPDLVVDFSSSSLLGLDDSALEQDIMDTFVFDAASSAFNLTSEITLFEGEVPVSDTVTAFTLAVDSSLEVDPFTSLYDHVEGPGSVGGSDGSVPVPAPLALFLMGLPGLAFALGRGRSDRSNQPRS